MENNKDGGKENDHVGYVGSTGAKYSNPYQSNMYEEYSKNNSTTSKKGNNSKKENTTTPPINSSQEDISIDVTQTANVPLVYYSQPMSMPTVPTVPIATYYPTYSTPIASTMTPMAISYVTPGTATATTGVTIIDPNPKVDVNEDEFDSTEKDEDKDNNNKEGENKITAKNVKRHTSYFADNQPIDPEKEKELEEIMSELGMKTKAQKEKNWKYRLINNQIFLIIAALIVFAIAILLYFVWPRIPQLTIIEILPYGDNPIQYKFPFDVENRSSYLNIAAINETEVKDLSASLQFDVQVKYNVKNNNFLKYKVNSLFIEVNK